MQNPTQIEDVVRRKTLELCEAIVQQPEFRVIRQRVEQFLADEPAQLAYQTLSEKGRALHEKQHQGVELEKHEVAEFDSEREALFRNPVAKGFIDAQEQMHTLQEGVHQYVSKTFELGRVPSADDLENCSCGDGCDCEH